MPAPVNDNIENALAIAGDVSVTTRDATFQPGEPRFGHDEGRTVWYSFVPERSGALTIDTFGSTFDTTLALFALTDPAAGAHVGNLTTLGENDDAGSQQSRLDLTVVANQTYYLRLGGYGGAGGPADINFTGVTLAGAAPAPGGGISLSISGSSVIEGDSGLTPGAFTVTRGGDVGTTLDVSYTFGGTATLGSDYRVQATVGVIRFSPGETSASLPFFVVGDRVAEDAETVTLALSASSGNSSARANGTVSIIDDDRGGNGGGNVSLSIAGRSVTEGDSGLTEGSFTVTRGGDVGAALDVSYTFGGTATLGSDYRVQATVGVIRFAPGETTANLPFFVVGDRVAEDAETVSLTLVATSGNSTARASAAVSIIDDDFGGGGSQTGTSGNDILIAAQPGATLIGGRGDDTYLVHNLGDTVIENRGEGFDWVYTDVSYNLGENEVEVLSVALQRGTDAINLTGNYNSQTIVGNYGNNLLNGGSGADTLIGLRGNDLYAINDSRIVIVEAEGEGSDTVSTLVSYTLASGVSVEVLAAQDRASTSGLALTGNAFDQTILGGAGADTLNGGGGHDVLIGGGGADVFAFTARPVATSAAGLADFQAGTDRIGLGATFGVGARLDASEFLVGTAATTADQRIIYNQQSGQLFYDADGNGAGAAVVFALVAPGTALSASDFIVLAGSGG